MNRTLVFDYFYGMQADAYTFYRIPKVLFSDPYFKKLSCEAKVLYGLLLDRMSLSVKNKWFDEQGRVYILFKVEDVCEHMGCCKQTAIKLFAELDSQKGIGLIEKKRLGLGKANVIYVKNFMLREEMAEAPETPVNTQKSKNHTSGNPNNRLQEVQVLDFKNSKTSTSGSSEIIPQEILKHRLQEVQKSSLRKSRFQTVIILIRIILILTRLKIAISYLIDPGWKEGI